MHCRKGRGVYKPTETSYRLTNYETVHLTAVSEKYSSSGMLIFVLQKPEQFVFKKLFDGKFLKDQIANVIP